MRTWSGVDRIRIEVTIELMQLDLPAPVAPAMRRWGMVAEVHQDGPAGDVAADATSSGCVALRASSELRMSPSATRWRCRFGTSTPIA